MNFRNVLQKFLITKSEKAIKMIKKIILNTFILAGGVASNKFIRESLVHYVKNTLLNFLCQKRNYVLIMQL